MDHTMSRYMNVKLAYQPSFFPDGQRIAFLSDITGVPQVWKTAIPAPGEPVQWPDQLTFEQDRVLSVQCSRVPGDNRVLYTRDSGGNEKAQLFLLDTDTGREIALTAGHEDAMHIPGEWSQDGRQVLFAATRRDPGLFDVYLQPLDGPARMIWQNDAPGFVYNMIFAPDGQRVTALRMASSFDQELFEIDMGDGSVRQLTSAPEPVSYHAACYTPDGRALIVNTDRDSDFMHLARLDLDTLEWSTLVPAQWDVDGFTLAPDGHSLFYALNVEGASELYLLDLDTGTTRRAPAVSDTPGIAVVQYEFHAAFTPDSSQLAFSFISPTRTADCIVWDLAADTVRPVTRSSHGGLPVEAFIGPELIHYPTFDRDDSGQTRQIPAWFYRPRSDHPAPVVVVVHGGPESQSRPQFLFYIQAMLQAGYAVLVPNVRGSTGYGKTYHHLDDVEKRMDSVADLAHAAHWLKQQPGIDGERIVVYGGSYGGFMVLSALTTYPDLWAAGVDIVGISSFVTFLKNTSAYRRAHREAEYGSLARDRAFLERIAPINHVDRITAPLMVIHGANDPRVPLSEAEQMVAALKTRGVPVEFLVFDDEGHGIVKLKNRLVAYPAILDFLRTHVPPDKVQ